MLFKSPVFLRSVYLVSVTRSHCLSVHNSLEWLFTQQQWVRRRQRSTARLSDQRLVYACLSLCLWFALLNTGASPAYYSPSLWRAADPLERARRMEAGTCLGASNKNSQWFRHKYIYFFPWNIIIMHPYINHRNKVLLTCGHAYEARWLQSSAIQWTGVLLHLRGADTFGSCAHINCRFLNKLASQ